MDNSSSPGATGATRIAAAKTTLRNAIENRRLASLGPEKVAADHDRTALIEALFSRSLPDKPTIALYLSTPTEPSTLALVSHFHVNGCPILLPRLDNFPEPQWSWYSGPDDLEPGRFAIAQPTGPLLGPGALASSDAIILPSLGATNYGVRLGMGAGWYDRALTYANRESPRITLLSANEVFESLPFEATDQLIDVITTEADVIVCADHEVTSDHSRSD